MPAWAHCITFVVACSSENVHSQKTEQLCRPGRFASPQDRRWPFENRSTSNQAEPLKRNLFDSSPVPVARRFVLVANRDRYTDQQRSAHGQCCAESNKGHTGTRSPPCRSPGSDLFFISKRLGSAIFGQPYLPPLIASTRRTRTVDAPLLSRCSWLSVHPMLAYRARC
jgi:hypothetical protein